MQPEAAFYHSELNEFMLPYRGGANGGSPGPRDRRIRPEHLRSSGDARGMGSGGARASPAAAKSADSPTKWGHSPLR